MCPSLASVRAITSVSAGMQRSAGALAGQFTGPFRGQSAGQFAGQLDTMALYGFLCLFFTGVFLIYQEYSKPARVGLVVCLFSNAIYAILSGVWPLACVMIMWAVATMRRPTVGRGVPGKGRRGRSMAGRSAVFIEETRISRLFGPTDIRN